MASRQRKERRERRSTRDRDAEEAAHHSGGSDTEERGGRSNGVNGAANESLPLVLFNASKNELKPLGGGSFKTLQSKFRAQYRFASNKEELTRERLEGVRAVVFPGSRTKFDGAEVKVIEEYLARGGNVLFCGSEPTEPQQGNGLLGDEAGGLLSGVAGGGGNGRLREGLLSPEGSAAEERLVGALAGRRRVRRCRLCAHSAQGIAQKWGCRRCRSSSSSGERRGVCCLRRLLPHACRVPLRRHAAGQQARCRCCPRES